MKEILASETTPAAVQCVSDTNAENPVAYQSKTSIAYCLAQFVIRFHIIVVPQVLRSVRNPHVVIEYGVGFESF